MYGGTLYESNGTVLWLKTSEGSFITYFCMNIYVLLKVTLLK
jgi:hypothetical protein